MDPAGAATLPAGEGEKGSALRSATEVRSISKLRRSDRI